eukprot:scaffold105273_cov38-Phaeocystis_antarctica.AAC.1
MLWCDVQDVVGTALVLGVVVGDGLQVVEHDEFVVQQQPRRRRQRERQLEARGEVAHRHRLVGPQQDPD